MEINKVDKVNFTKLEQAVLDVIRKHSDGKDDLAGDLFSVIALIDEQRSNNEAIKEIALLVANKI